MSRITTALISGGVIGGALVWVSRNNTSIETINTGRYEIVSGIITKTAQNGFWLNIYPTITDADTKIPPSKQVFVDTRASSGSPPSGDTIGMEARCLLFPIIPDGGKLDLSSPKQYEICRLARFFEENDTSPDVEFTPIEEKDRFAACVRYNRNPVDSLFKKEGSH